MSEIAEAAHVTLIIADYAVVTAHDARVTAVGAGWQVITPILTPDGAVLPAMSVACLVEVPQRYAGEQVAVTLTFRDGAGNPVLSPAPPGVEPQPIRVGQVYVIQKPMVAGQYVPETVPARIAVAAILPPGLPIDIGPYSWTLDIDGETSPDWYASFHVIQPPVGPVFG